MALSESSGAVVERRRRLYNVARSAMLAPSILNTQPWRWTVHASRLDLYADLGRQIASVDPDRRLLTISCGAGLHHACVALRADGLSPSVRRWPDPVRLDHLAAIAVTDDHRTTRADLDLAASIRQRRSERRPNAARTRISADELNRLCRAATEQGATLHMVTDAQRRFLAAAARIAQASEEVHESYQRDLVAWVHDRPSGEGVPIETLVAGVVRPVPLRDLAGGGETGLHPGLGDDTNADYLVLTTADDDRPDWLRAGEALSAVWLTATVLGIVGSVLSDVIEVPDARTLVGSLLSEAGHPQLVLRMGIAAYPTPPPASPRRRPESVITVKTAPGR